MKIFKPKTLNLFIRFIAQGSIMTTIKKIEIKDFFGRGDFEWNLDSQVDILGGKNGSGKSSIFRSCYNLLSGNVMKDGLDWSFRDLFDRIRLTLSNVWTLTWKRIPTNTRTYLDYVQKWNEEAVTIVDDLGKERQLDELRENVQVFYLNSFEQSISRALQYEKQPSTQTLEDPLMLDLMIKDQINVRNTLRSRAVEKLFNIAKDDSKDALEFVSYLKKSDKVYESLGHFLQGYAKPFESDFSFVKNGVSIKYDKLSMGEKQILLLLLMVSNTEESPCIFFMDEPDLSMHIDWKEILVKELHELNPNMQIILSTHAPSVITGWQDRVREVEQLVSK